VRPRPCIIILFVIGGEARPLRGKGRREARGRVWGWKEQRRHFRTRCSFKGRGSFILWITGFFVIEIFLFSNLKILESNFELLAFEQRHFPRKAPSLILQFLDG